MPLTVTTRERSLILGGPDDEPELYDICRDPGGQRNVWRELGSEGEALAEQNLAFLESIGTPQEYLAPRREALKSWRAVWSWEGDRRVKRSYGSSSRSLATPCLRTPRCSDSGACPSLAGQRCMGGDGEAIVQGQKGKAGAHGPRPFR
jgi:hypothetical protein